MSVEQVRSAPVDRRSDIYSAAIVLWELLVGTKCFNADSDGAAALMAAEGVKQSPAEANAEVPASISACCMRALSVGPNDRFSTATEFAEALEDATLDAGVRPAKPRELGEYVRQWVEQLGATDAASGASKDLARAAQAVQRATNPSHSDASSPSHPSISTRPSHPTPASSKTGGTTGTKASVAMTHPGHRPGSSRATLPLAAVGAGLVGVALTVWLFGGAPSEPIAQPELEPTLSGAGEPAEARAEERVAEKEESERSEPESTASSDPSAEATAAPAQEPTAKLAAKAKPQTSPTNKKTAPAPAQTPFRPKKL